MTSSTNESSESAEKAFAENETTRPMADGVPSDEGNMAVANLEKTATDLTTTANGDTPDYPQGIKFFLILIALMLSMFLVALDMGIVATAIPRITVDFKSLNQVGWYGSAFFMCLATFVSVWGKAYKYLSLKYSFLSAVFLFEVGSLISGVSQNSITLIVGRAIQGAGGAGVAGGCYTIIAFIVPPPKVPLYMGLTGVIFSISSVAGPLLGGVFTEDVTWRWCFYINLPLGGFAILTLLFFFHNPETSNKAQATKKELLLTFDIPGIVLLLASLTSLFLALQWAGITKSWGSADVVGLLVCSGVLAVLFVLLELKQGERAMVVPRILKSRTTPLLGAFTCLLSAASFARAYNLPIYFQAVDGNSPAESGIRTLATVLALSITTLFCSGLLGRVGYFQPFFILSSIISTIGGGFIYTLKVESPASEYIGYQVLAGIGVGIAVQAPVIVAQALSARSDMSVTTSTILFFQLLGCAIGVSVGQNIFNNQLLESLASHAPTVTPAEVLAVGATGLRQAFTQEQLPGVLQSYLIGLKASWAWTIAGSGATFLVAIAMRWKSIKTKAPSQTAA